MTALSFLLISGLLYGSTIILVIVFYNCNFVDFFVAETIAI